MGVWRRTPFRTFTSGWDPCRPSALWLCWLGGESYLTFARLDHILFPSFPSSPFTASTSSWPSAGTFPPLFAYVVLCTCSSMLCPAFQGQHSLLTFCFGLLFSWWLSLANSGLLRCFPLLSVACAMPCPSRLTLVTHLPRPPVLHLVAFFCRLLLVLVLLPCF